MATRVLSESDLGFLDALREGESAASYARRNHYSGDWAKWKSKTIRSRLGVRTIEEAIAMSEVTRSDLDGLREMIRASNEAIKALADAVTPAQQQQAQQNVKDTSTDLHGELRLRGLTLKDLDAAQERKLQERIDAGVASALTAREAEAKAKEEEAARLAAENGNGEEEEQRRGGLLDGLGGRTWGNK